MHRALPSYVVSLIQQILPQAKNQIEGRPGDYSVSAGNLSQVQTIVSMVDKIPDELIVLQGDSFTKYTAAIGTLESYLTLWKTGGESAVTSIPGLGPYNPVTLLYEALSQCPDEYPSPDTTEMSFVHEEEFRQELRLDLSTMERALANSEWKAATVLGGSIVEALLLWKLDQHKNDNPGAISLSQISLGEKLGRDWAVSDQNKWHLSSYILVATDLNLISCETAQQLDLIKGFRNLIHPGRQMRLDMKCDRGTAFATVAGVELVVRDIGH